MVKALFVVLSLTLIAMCKTPMFNPSAYSGQYFLIGQGGGVTGREKGTCINDRGLIYTFEGLGDWQFTYQKKLPLDLFHQLESNYKVLKLNELQLQQPGNTYKFIEWSNGKQKQRLTWNEQVELNTKSAKLFYDIFQTITSK